MWWLMNSFPGAIPGFYIHPLLDFHGGFRVPNPQKAIIKLKQPQQALANCQKKPLVRAKTHAGEAAIRNHRPSSPVSTLCPEWRFAALAVPAVLAAHAAAACIAAAAGRI